MSSSKEAAMNKPVRINSKLNSKFNVKSIVKYRDYYIILIPAVVFFLIFSYYPMYGAIIAFKNFRAIDGIWDSAWVGLGNFRRLINTPSFMRVMRNTIGISLLRLVCGFPTPIILAILFNEVRSKKFLKTVSTLSYLPYFMSWVVLGGIFIQLLSPSTGAVNQVIRLFGGEPVYFLTSERWFIFILIVTQIWQGVGWGTIIYMATLSGIDTEMFEAAEMDGIRRFQKIWYIILPYLKPTVGLMLIFASTGILNAGFDQIFNMYNTSVYNVADVLDTYIYRLGIEGMEFSLSTSIGLFKNVVSFTMLTLVNILVKKLTESDGIW
jgi:putative aldouronate transport system permease protein